MKIHKLPLYNRKHRFGEYVSALYHYLESNELVVQLEPDYTVYGKIYRKHYGCGCSSEHIQVDLNLSIGDIITDPLNDVENVMIRRTYNYVNLISNGIIRFRMKNITQQRDRVELVKCMNEVANHFNIPLEFEDAPPFVAFKHELTGMRGILKTMKDYIIRQTTEEYFSAGSTSWQQQRVLDIINRVQSIATNDEDEVELNIEREHEVAGTFNPDHTIPTTELMSLTEE